MQAILASTIFIFLTHNQPQHPWFPHFSCIAMPLSYNFCVGSYSLSFWPNNSSILLLFTFIFNPQSFIIDIHDPSMLLHSTYLYVFSDITNSLLHNKMSRSIFSHTFFPWQAFITCNKPQTISLPFYQHLHSLQFFHFPIYTKHFIRHKLISLLQGCLMLLFIIYVLLVLVHSIFFVKPSYFTFVID